MIAEHALLYLGARVFAAAANLAAVAIFTRLAAADVYGGYLLVFSWAFVIYGFLDQWLGTTFFAVYQQESEAAQIGTLGRLVLGSLVAAAIVIATGAASGLVSWPMAGALFLAICGLSIFGSVMEAERTRLEARLVSSIYVLRAALIISLGAVALATGGGALALAVALALANMAAALPGLVRLAPHFTLRLDRAAMGRFFDYGWPLIIAYGATALGQHVDRLILAHIGGTAELGPYGATSDFLKQSFQVVSEAIVLAAISIAKNAAIRGDAATARRTLEDAFRALTATVSFGAVFMLTFADELVAVIFGPEFRSIARTLMPSLIAVNAVLVFRAFYFGQSIYFGQSSRNEVIASALMLSVTGTLAATLIPLFGVFGAAWAATAGQLAACTVFILARPRMPIPLRSFAGIVAAAALLFAGTAALDHVALLGGVARLAAKLVVFVAASLFIIWRFNILGLPDFAGTLARNRLASTPVRDNARLADPPWE